MTTRRDQKILRSLPRIPHLPQDVSDELQTAAAALDQQHERQLAATARLMDHVLAALESVPESVLEVLDRISPDTIGIVLTDGNRFYLTAETA